MKLIIDTSTVAPSILTVVNGDNVVYTIQTFTDGIKSAIDVIFEEKYIEAVYFTAKNDFNQKFIDYIEDKYKGVEIL